MARRRGIPEERLRRLGQELERAKAGEFDNYGARYKRAFESAVSDANRAPSPPEPDTAPDDTEDTEDSQKSIRELCDEVFLNYDEAFNVHYTPGSTRVKSIQFIPRSDDHVREVIERLLAGGYRHRKGITTEELIEGTIHVFWQNDKPLSGWLYEDRKLQDFIDMKDAPSVGKHIAENYKKGSASRGRSAESAESSESSE